MSTARTSATYLYALVRNPGPLPTKGAPPGLPGLAAVRTLAVGDGLWLVSADAPLPEYGADSIQSHLQDLSWVSDRALAHEATVEHFSELAGPGMRDPHEVVHPVRQRRPRPGACASRSRPLEPDPRPDRRLPGMGRAHPLRRGTRAGAGGRRGTAADRKAECRDGFPPAQEGRKGRVAQSTGDGAGERGRGLRRSHLLERRRPAGASPSRRCSWTGPFWSGPNAPGISSRK